MNEMTHIFGMGLGGWIIPLIVLVVILYLFTGSKGQTATHSSAQEILDKRYASGGISKEEYEEKSKDLQEHA